MAGSFLLRRAIKIAIMRRNPEGRELSYTAKEMFRPNLAMIVSHQSTFPTLSPFFFLIPLDKNSTSEGLLSEKRKLSNRKLEQGDVFEPLTETGGEHFACPDSGLSQIFKLIVSATEKYPTI